MSKTVIVFSTRFNSPHQKNCLFNEGSSSRDIFTSQELADYFWEDIKKDKDYLKSLLTDEYYVNQQKKDLVDFLKKYQNDFIEVIKYNNIKTPFSIEDYTWIGDIFVEDIDFPLKNELREKYIAFKESSDNTEFFETNNGLELCNNLRADPNAIQESFNLDPDKPSVNGPWLAYRFSYYKLDNSDNDVSVYAVWPLLRPSPQIDGKYTWVEVLTNQFLTKFNPYAEEIYLILHDKDIEESLFKVIIDDKFGKATRLVALFQHVDDMGFFLEHPSEKEPIEIKNYVKSIVIDARVRKWLFDAFDHIANDNIDQLWGVASKLIKLDEDRFKCIFEIVDKIEKNKKTATEPYLDELKKDLVCQLNLNLKDYMIL